MKDYLNREERRDFILFKKCIDIADKILHKWDITKDEHYNLASMTTFGIKTYEAMLERMSDSAIRSFAKTLQQTSITVEDKYAISVYNKKMSSNMADCYEKNKDYYTIIELILYNNCRGCEASGNVCEFCREMDEHLVPGGDDNLPNCKYAQKK